MIAIHIFAGHTVWNLEPMEYESVILKSLSSSAETTIYANSAVKPIIGQMFTVINDTAYTQTIKADSAATGVSIRAGTKAEIYWDGYDFRQKEETQSNDLKTDFTKIENDFSNCVGLVLEDFGGGVSVADNTAAMVAAIAQAETSKKPIVLGVGTYTFASKIIVPTNIRIIGQGNSFGSGYSATRLKYTGNEYLFELGTNAVTSNVRFINFLITSETGGGINFTINRVGLTLCEDIRFATKGISVRMSSDTGYNRFFRCIFVATYLDLANSYVYLDGDSETSVYPNYVYFTECSFEGDFKAYKLITLGHCQEIYFNHCDLANTIEPGSAFFILPDCNIYPLYVHVTHTTLWTNHVAIWTQSTTNTNDLHMIFSQCMFICTNLFKFDNTTLQTGPYSFTNCMFSISYTYFLNGIRGSSAFVGGNNRHMKDVLGYSSFNNTFIGLPITIMVTIPASESVNKIVYGTSINVAFPTDLVCISINPDVTVSVVRNSISQITITATNTTASEITTSIQVSRVV